MDKIRESPIMLTIPDETILPGNPLDFNYGYAIGFIEGQLASIYKNCYGIDMSLEGKNEFTTLTRIHAAEIKKLIFKYEA